MRQQDLGQDERRHGHKSVVQRTLDVFDDEGCNLGDHDGNGQVKYRKLTDLPFSHNAHAQENSHVHQQSQKSMCGDMPNHWLKLSFQVSGRQAPGRSHVLLV
ncbi:hypothetical protein D3C71_1536840 [compost metagenome]